MKLIDILHKVDKSERNTQRVDHEQLCSSLNIQCSYGCFDYELFDTLFKSYWITKWLCTDTWVGTRALYCEGVLVGMIQQTARKNDEYFYFLSKRHVALCKEAIEKCIEEDEDNATLLTDEELEAELGLFYSIEYAGQQLEKTCYKDGKEYEIVKDYTRTDQGCCHPKYFHTVVVRDKQSGHIKDMDVRELNFKIKLEGDEL